MEIIPYRNISADVGILALKSLNEDCVNLGGTPELANIYTLDNGLVDACNMCRLCNSDVALSEMQNKQVSCESDCGFWQEGSNCYDFASSAKHPNCIS
ncbi:hypothetical protein AGMMS49938_16590 [Fibrobacterales bacterium]|nr:hypothetical protein AGMMS49938_16590 [Fibrobacterales bacterium]